MAVLTSYITPIFTSISGTVVYADSARITIVGGSVTQNYYGTGFAFSGYSVIGGTVTGTNLYDASNGGWQYEITGLSHDAATVWGLVNIGDGGGLQSFLLNGNDSVYGNSGGDYLNASTGEDLIYGYGGNDTLYGGSGFDTLVGGPGDDNYYFFGPSSANIIEINGEGYDTITILSGPFITIPDHVEALVLNSSGGAGNSLGNLITASFGDNLMEGGGGSDTLSGGPGFDTLDGGSGDDFLYGGQDSDYYVVDSFLDVISDIGGSSDTVISVINNYVLPEGLEGLTLGATVISGSGNDLSNTLRGNDLGNLLYGGGGSIDFLYGNDGDDTLFGGDGYDYIVGGFGNDWLNSGSGNDYLEGESGDDIYVIDSSLDQVIENPGSFWGRDTVISTVTFTLGSNLENLILTGSLDINGTGNAGQNLLSGNSGDNQLNGGGEADIIAGGLGNDIYVVDNSGDQVMELGNSGMDIVRSEVSYDLMQAWHVENLILIGGATIDAGGNWLDNMISGNARDNQLSGNRGNDTLDGGGGSDTLIGGLGDDVLVWDAADASVDGGAGFDRLQLNGSGITLNLTALADNLITGVEAIDLTGSGNNTLTLALGDVLVLSYTTDILRVDGNEGDAVNAGSGWASSGTQVHGAQNYAVYTQLNATLLVDVDVLVTLA